MLLYWTTKHNQLKCTTQKSEQLSKWVSIKQKLVENQGRNEQLSNNASTVNPVLLPQKEKGLEFQRKMK